LSGIRSKPAPWTRFSGMRAIFAHTGQPGGILGARRRMARRGCMPICANTKVTTFLHPIFANFESNPQSNDNHKSQNRQINEPRPTMNETHFSAPPPFCQIRSGRYMAGQKDEPVGQAFQPDRTPTEDCPAQRRAGKPFLRSTASIHPNGDEATKVACAEYRSSRPSWPHLV
jgi:hypothetical protein